MQMCVYGSTIQKFPKQETIYMPIIRGLGKNCICYPKSTVQGKKDVTVSVSNEERSSVLWKP